MSNFYPTFQTLWKYTARTTFELVPVKPGSRKLKKEAKEIFASKPSETLTIMEFEKEAVKQMYHYPWEKLAELEKTH